MTTIHRFEDSRDSHGNGYSAYIENDKLVLEYDSPREGGVIYRGNYFGAAKYLAVIKRYDRKLWDNIENYYTKHGVPETTEQLKEKLQFDEATKTILFKVKLHMDDGHTIHSVLVRGRFQADVIKKLFPPVPEVLTLQTYNANVFAVRSEKISAVEFVED